MLIRNLVLTACGLLLTANQAQASLITFNATGVADITGFVQFDKLSFDGSTNQPVSNTFITDLQLTVFGESFTLANVSAGAFTYIDSSGLLNPLPIIVDGAGNLADNGSQAIAFWSELFGDPIFDGDATLVTGASGDLAGENFYAVQWVPELASVPEPGTLALLGLGLSGLGCCRFRRHAFKLLQLPRTVPD